MSYLRSGHPLKHFEGNSESYVFTSCGFTNEQTGEDHPPYIEDYDDKYKDNATFAQLIINIAQRELDDEKFVWKLAGVLAKKLNIKRRKKPLTIEQYFKLMDENMKEFKKQMKKDKRLSDLNKTVSKLKKRKV